MVSREAIIEMRNRGKCLENEGKPWSDEDSQAVRFYFDMGYGLTEIAVILNRSERGVFQQLTLMDAFRSPIKRTPLPKEPKCLCGGCKLDPALCPHRECCPKLKGAAKC